MRIVIRVFPAGVFKTGPRLPLVESYCAFMALPRTARALAALLYSSLFHRPLTPQITRLSRLSVGPVIHTYPAAALDAAELAALHLC